MTKAIGAAAVTEQKLSVMQKLRVLNENALLVVNLNLRRGGNFNHDCSFFILRDFCYILI